MTYTAIHTIRFIVLGIVLLISFFFTTHVHAYFTTNQEALKLDGHSALFLIDYSFGMSKHEVFLPVYAHNQTVEKSNTAVSYTILNSNDEEVMGKMSAIVFSKASLQTNATYVTNKGQSKSFTLAVVFTPDTYIQDETYRLQVTHLPFNFDGVQQLQLNPSELTYYTTKPISL